MRIPTHDIIRLQYGRSRYRTAHELLSMPYKKDKGMIFSRILESLLLSPLCR